MGGDGGVIASQRKFIRGTKTGDGEGNSHDERNSARRQNQITRTRICTQSGEKLEEPIVCCEMGNLYKKEAMLQALLSKTVVPACLHVRGLKDLKTLIFTPSPEYKAEREVNGEYPAKYICPITKQEFNGQQPFMAIWSTGHVLSERAIKQLGIDALQAEYGPFTADDIIKLNPMHEEEIDSLRTRMIARRNSAKLAKLEKRKAKDVADATAATVEESMKKRKTISASAATHSSSSSAGTGASTADGGLKKLSKHDAVVRSAVDAVNRQSESDVFRGLFHKDKEKDKRDRDLFMSVAGLRYTVG